MVDTQLSQPDAGVAAPTADRQVGVLRHLLRQRPTAVLSLDCFDTLVWRSVPKPTDVFTLVGHRLRHNGLLRNGTTPELFARMRVVAEQTARAAAMASRHSSEVHLREIYGLVGWRRATACSADDLAQAEIDVELDVTTADPWVQALVEEETGAVDGRRVMVVSDTYFDAGTVAAILERAGLGGLARSRIFTSSEHGVSKEQGLLRLAAAASGVAPADVIHVGNNPVADVQAAVQAGMAAFHLPELAPRARRWVAAEGWLGAHGQASTMVDPEHGDSGLTALRGRIERCRPDTVPEADALYWEVGATVLGPVLGGFGEWVHERAGELGIDTALCLMREGRLFAQVLDGVPEDRRRCRAVPFWASREACVRAAFLTAAPHELSRVLWRPDVPTPEAVLDTLGLTVEELPGGRGTLDRLAATGDASRALLELVGSRQDLREQVVARSAARRRAYVEYLVQAVGSASKAPTVGLVDLGFGGTIQQLLHVITSAENVEMDFHGLYLFASTRALSRQVGGLRIEGFVADAGSAVEDAAALQRSPQILEVLTTSEDGTFLEMGTDGRPVLAQRGPEARQDGKRRAVHDGVQTFQRAWNLLDGGTLARRRSLAASGDVLRKVLHTFVAAPGSEVAAAFGDWEFDVNMGSDRREQLVPEAIRRCAGYLPPEHLVLSNEPDLYWVGGAAALCGTENEVAALQRGEVTPGAYVHADGSDQLTLAMGERDGTETVVASMPLHWYRAGRGVIAWSGRTQADRLSLRSSGETAVLRVDQVTVARADGSVDRFDLRQAPATVDGVTIVADAPVAGATAVLSLDQAIAIRFTRKASVPVVGVEVLYAVMRA